MGTNYYLKTEEKPPCECCKRPYPSEDLHIGKSSGGWCFSLHVIPEDGINSLEDWQQRWSAPGVWIENEYGEKVTPEQMLKSITERGRPERLDDWTDADYRRNHAVPGPHFLARHAIGDHCIGHGPGTYDYITGWFS